MSGEATQRARLWMAFGTAFVVLKLWLVSAQPVVAIGGAGHDDRLYLELANHLLNGEWLGTYSQFTLMKGPMYSFWIAAMMEAGVPLPLSQHLLYLGGCVLVVRALRPYVHGGASFALFAMLWWNPMTYEMPVLGRVLRQNIYTPLTLLFFAGLIALATRRASPRRVRVAWGILLGTSGAALWLTREESMWIVPSAVLLVGIAFYLSRTTITEQKSSLLAVAVAAVVSASIVGSVSLANLRHYGWFGTVEFRASEFLDCYGALQRVNSVTSVPYVPVTREAREKIYAISPAFAELRPFLDGKDGLGWAAASASFTGRSPEAGEIAGGWFMWALRDAVAFSGHATNARSALDFYSKIAREINEACDNQRLAAGPHRSSMIPVWHAEFAHRAAEEFGGYAWYLARFRGFDATPSNSSGSANLLALFRDMTRWQLAPSPEAPELQTPHQMWEDARRIHLLQWIGTGACWIMSTATLAGLAAWTLVLGRSICRRRFSFLHGVSSAALGGAVAVAAINFLVHVMSFPNKSPGAFAQAYPLLILFSVLALLELKSPAKLQLEQSERSHLQQQPAMAET